MAGNNGGNIPKFGEWKTTDGGSPYTMYFDNARKRRNNSGITVPPEASPAPVRTNTVPGGHRTPPRAPGVKPLNQQDGANRSRNQAKAAQGSSVPTWGQWNESNSGAGAHQYTLFFDQLREERKSAPPTPSVEQLQKPHQTRPTHRDLYDHVPKGSKCCGLFWENSQPQPQYNANVMCKWHSWISHSPNTLIFDQGLNRLSRWYTWILRLSTT